MDKGEISLSLYNDFAIHYDSIFPTDDTTIAFLQSQFRRKRLLDLGCATGGYALALTDLGYQVDGIDLDYRMIAIAKSKTTESSHYPAFSVGNMLDLSVQETYDGIYCIGNTLVHLPDMSHIQLMLKSIFQSLVSKGVAVVQIVNYDRILNRHIEKLTTITNAGRQFERKYVFQDHGLVFQTVLTYQNERYSAETPLVPLCSQELWEAFLSAGFVEIERFGDFDCTAFDSFTSFALVLVAKKP